MEKSSLWACVVAVLMLGVGGYLAYDGYSGEARVKNDSDLATAKTDLESQAKKAKDQEARLTKLSAALGFHDLRNWLTRKAYLKKWSDYFAGQSDVTKALDAYGTDEYKIDPSRGLSESEIALCWALQIQASDNPVTAYNSLVSTELDFKKALDEETAAILKAFDKQPKPEMPLEEQEKLQKEWAEAAELLDPGRKPWTSPKAMGKFFENWANICKSWKERGADWAPDPTSTAREVLDTLDATISKLQTKITETNKARDAERANLLAIIGEIDAEGKPVKAGSMADEEKKKDDSIKALQEEIAGIRTKIADKIREGESALGSLDKEIAEATVKLNMMVAEKQEKIKELEAKLSDTKERFAKLQARQAAVVETTEADGQLLYVDLQRGIAHVDIGRVHTLFRGTRFEVFRIVKAGKKKTLGEIEILDLGEERSRVAILSVTDPSDLPAAGDLVSNVSFDRNKPKVFSIAGQLKFKYSRDDMRRRLAEWGARVADDVNPTTSILIVGDRYHDDPNWQRALDIGTPIMRERELYDALGIE